MTPEFVIILFGLTLVAFLYASVGHGGASGYLAILSLTSYASMSNEWLKQHAWCLNLVVAGIAFYHYRKAGHHNSSLTIPFIVTSIPAAFLGGMMVVNDVLYDTLLSFVLIWAAIRIVQGVGVDSDDEIIVPPKSIAMGSGVGIGGISGIIGVGGGIFLSPLLILKRWGTAKTVAATSAVFIWANSLAGLLGVIVRDGLDLDISTLGPFSICVIFGGLVGSRYGAGDFSQYTIRRLLAFVLILAAMRRVIELIL